MGKLTEHFDSKEMSCHCQRKTCDALPMKRSFLEKLEALRIEWGKPLSPTSAARCSYWNLHVGGSPKSQHLLGNACDFIFQTKEEIESFVILAEKYGFEGIGVGKHLVHIDNRKKPGRWTYGDK